MHSVGSLLVAALIVLGAAIPAAAADFPTREVQIVIPWAAGGATDLVFRALAVSTARHLGKAVVIVNKPGAAGAVGYTEAMQARPDGYTLVTAASPLSEVPSSARYMKLSIPAKSVSGV